MKLRVAVERLRLGLGASALKLALGAQRLKLDIVAFSRLKLAVAVGIFIRFIEKQDNFFVQSLVAKLLQRSVNEDPVRITDNANISFNKARSDGGAFSDGEQYFAEDYVTGAPLAQTYTEGKQINWIMTKPVTEAPVVSDLFVPVLQKVFSDGFNITDDVDGDLTTKDDQTISFTKSLDHVPVVSDADFIIYGKPLSELPTVADLLQVSYVTARSDSFAVSDAAGITLSTIKTESTIVSDVVLRVIQNAYSETPTLSDAGSLRSQGYAEFDYFAEDYVGESRAF